MRSGTRVKLGVVLTGVITAAMFVSSEPVVGRFYGILRGAGRSRLRLRGGA